MYFNPGVFTTIPIAAKICFLCDEEGDILHEVMTFDLDSKVCNCAEIVKDTLLWLSWLVVI